MVITGALEVGCPAAVALFCASSFSSRSRMVVLGGGVRGDAVEPFVVGRVEATGLVSEEAGERDVDWTTENAFDDGRTDKIFKISNNQIVSHVNWE